MFAWMVSFSISSAAVSTPASVTPDEVSPSRIRISASLSLQALQQKLRNAVAAALKGQTIRAKTYGTKQVSVTITPTVLSDQLTVRGIADGRLKVGIPIRVGVGAVISGITNLAVYADGCRDTTFTVSAMLAPSISPTGELSYRIQSVANDNTGYRCRIVSTPGADAASDVKEFFDSGLGLGRKPKYGKAVHRDVSTELQAGLRERANALFSDRITDFNRMMPDADVLYAMLKNPAVFGTAITLGIDAPSLRVTGVSASGDDYRVNGVLEGFPRLVFGDVWEESQQRQVTDSDKPGFHLPARILFPTDRRLRPDASVEPPSGCVGGFRLSRVPGRQDMAALQRCDTEAQENVIWLSGRRDVPLSDVFEFDRALTNVLDDIVAWLGDASLWRGVDGVEALRHEVELMQQRLDGFQWETELPIDTRGVIRFDQLSLDLRRVWVTDEAILADVVLNGQARLDLKLSF